MGIWDILKQLEGLQLVAYPEQKNKLFSICKAQNTSIYNNSYRAITNWQDYDSGDWAIGYGHTSKVKAGDRITNQQADKFLLEDIKSAELSVNLVSQYWKDKTDNQIWKRRRDTNWNKGFNKD